MRLCLLQMRLCLLQTPPVSKSAAIKRLNRQSIVSGVLQRRDS
jgi:hypothetical protein